ncbi:MAG: hypothetical protein QOF25_4111, partial [Mycobacterium sp.]|nr:hypothetical protein [Mycobacterium sp.]
EEPWGEALWQEIVLTDGRRLIMWRADDESSSTEGYEPPAPLINTVGCGMARSVWHTHLAGNGAPGPPVDVGFVP